MCASITILPKRWFEKRICYCGVLTVFPLSIPGSRQHYSNTTGNLWTEKQYSYYWFYIKYVQHWAQISTSVMRWSFSTSKAFRYLNEYASAIQRFILNNNVCKNVITSFPTCVITWRAVGGAIPDILDLFRGTAVSWLWLPSSRRSSGGATHFFPQVSGSDYRPFLPLPFKKHTSHLLSLDDTSCARHCASRT